ncbi:MAG TPA: hypothetical protein PLD23_13775 [Armatimonadota bacterium]|nr:hypothetical protein [Armatimonadota bacterium]
MATNSTSGPTGSKARRLLLRVEAIGKTDRLKGVPYEELLWYEGRRAGLPWPSVWWWLQGIGIVAGAADETPLAEQAAAVAVDQVRLALRTPQGMAQSRRSLDEGPDLALSLRNAMIWANRALRESAQGQADRRATVGASVACAAMRGNKTAVAWIGDCRCYHVRGQTCSLIDDPVGASTSPGVPHLDPSPVTPATGTPDSGLGAADDIQPCVRELDVEVGDVLVLLSPGVRHVLDGPDDIARYVAEADSLEEACERLLVDARMKGSRGTNSVVMMGVAPDRTGQSVADPSRDPLAFSVALHAAALPPGTTLDTLGCVRQLLGLEAPKEEAPPAPAEPAPPAASAEAPPMPQTEVVTPSAARTPEPGIIDATLVREHVISNGLTASPPTESGPAAHPQPMEPPPPPTEEQILAEQSLRRPVQPPSAGRRWQIGLAAALILIAMGGPAAWHFGARARNTGAPSPPEPAKAEGAPATPRAPGMGAALTERPEAEAPSPPAPARNGDAGAYAFELAPNADGRGVTASLNDGAPGPVDVVLQRFRQNAIEEVARQRLKPGERVALPLPRDAYPTSLTQKQGIRLCFTVDSSGDLAWAPSGKIVLPKSGSVSIEDSKIYLVHRLSPIILAVKALPSPGQGPSVDDPLTF